MEDIYGLIEELENEITTAKSAVFSKKVMIDADHCHSILQKIKENLPDTIRQAERVITQAESLVSSAEERANKITKEAEMRAEEIVSESELLKRAESEAESIRGEAKQFNDTIKRNAKIYVDNLFEDVEKFLADSIATVRNNREELRGSLIKDKK